MQIYEEALRLKRLGRISAIATIVECRGSSPQKQGAKMLVRDDGTSIGTLGGGCLEADVVQTCIMAMKDEEPRTLPFSLTEKEGGLVCGGAVLVYIEPVLIEPHLVILGAGHVGKALTKLARFAGFRVTVMDDRREFANPEQVPDAHELIVGDFSKACDTVTVGPGTYIVVATRGHNHDLDAVHSALRTNAGYIGLLGSRRKKALLKKTLEERGFTQEDISRVIIPVGLEIGSTTPEEIGISIMAQIVQQRRSHVSSRGRAGSCGRLVNEDGAVEAAAATRQ
jgi:xanthine dehydrogenase accessory factor